MKKLNGIGLPEREDALDQYFQALFFNEPQEGESREHAINAVEVSAIALDELSNCCRQDCESSKVLT